MITVEYPGRNTFRAILAKHANEKMVKHPHKLDDKHDGFGKEHEQWCPTCKKWIAVPLA